MSAPSKKTRLLSAALLFPASALAAPVWLDCSGDDKRINEGRTVAHTIKVMFDGQSNSVQVYDGSLSMTLPESVEITPVKVVGMSPTHSFHVDRNSGRFYYMRFDRSRTNTSYMAGECRPSANPPKPRF